MKFPLLAAAFATAVLLATAPVQAQERLRDGLVGAGAGAIVGGPVGAVVGAGAGYVAGPSVTRGVGRAVHPRYRYRHYRHRHYRHYR